MTQREEIKRIVLERISLGKTYIASGRSKYRIGDCVVHLRFCSTDKFGSPRYKFNINPNTLTADYEIWICGDADTYYLLPIKIMQQIYYDQGAYVDYHHPEIRVVSVNIETNTVTYASDGKKLHMDEYLHRKLL